MSLPAPTVPFTYAALQAEITNDPLTLGYANLSDTQKANLLNSTTSSGAGPVWRTNIPSLQVLQAIVSADYMALTALQLQELSTILQIGTFDATNTNTAATFSAIFTGKPNTITSFTTLAIQTGGRAQVLWGIGAVISVQQIGIARNGS